jgi:hypothetical protein
MLDVDSRWPTLTSRLLIGFWVIFNDILQRRRG